MGTQSAEFSLLSLNTFGIPFYLGWERMTRLARELDALPATAVCLQEVQQNAYGPLLERRLTTYPHHIYERHHYAPKGGLAVFSRIPIDQHNFEVYQSRGTLLSISFADWALYKGILTVIYTVDGLPIIVLNTHMNANYSGIWHRSNPLSQIQLYQVQQLTRVIQSLPEEALVIICGDLNFPRASFLYEELVGQNNLVDPMVDDERPTYRPFPLVPAKWKVPLDFALVRQPVHKTFHIHADIIEVEDALKSHPVQRFLTDHNALLLQIKWDSADRQSNAVDHNFDKIE
jgi:endonuclease/exonuclease/phosphatase family metal-dependent hydrolase